MGTKSMIETINHGLAMNIRPLGRANSLVFIPSTKNGHFTAEMNHDFQKYNEEDAMCVILDAMEQMGWTFRFQYDSETYSAKFSGSSMTSRELFLFSKAS